MLHGVICVLHLHLSETRVLPEWGEGGGVLHVIYLIALDLCIEQRIFPHRIVKPRRTQKRKPLSTLLNFLRKLGALLDSFFNTANTGAVQCGSHCLFKHVCALVTSHAAPPSHVHKWFRQILWTRRSGAVGFRGYVGGVFRCQHPAGTPLQRFRVVSALRKRAAVRQTDLHRYCWLL